VREGDASVAGDDDSRKDILGEQVCGVLEVICKLWVLGPCKGVT
jgi:hypothetical protein